MGRLVPSCRQGFTYPSQVADPAVRSVPPVRENGLPVADELAGLTGKRARPGLLEALKVGAHPPFGNTSDPQEARMGRAVSGIVTPSIGSGQREKILDRFSRTQRRSIQAWSQMAIATIGAGLV